MLYITCKLKLFTDNKTPLETITLYPCIHPLVCKVPKGLPSINESCEAHQSLVGIRRKDTHMPINCISSCGNTPGSILAFLDLDGRVFWWVAMGQSGIVHVS
jgi:hypothetical protein